MENNIFKVGQQFSVEGQFGIVKTYTVIKRTEKTVTFSRDNCNEYQKAEVRLNVHKSDFEYVCLSNAEGIDYDLYACDAISNDEVVEEDDNKKVVEALISHFENVVDRLKDVRGSYESGEVDKAVDERMMAIYKYLGNGSLLGEGYKDVLHLIYGNN